MLTLERVRARLDAGWIGGSWEMQYLVTGKYVEPGPLVRTFVYQP
jgi:hypothetical protein